MISLATVIMKWSSRGTPLTVPPRPMMQLRSTRSFMSRQRLRMILRVSMSHGDSTSSFSDEDAQLIRFFEILIYSQTLKRIGFSDSDIERIIGALFGCNYVLVQEKYH